MASSPSPAPTALQSLRSVTDISSLAQLLGFPPKTLAYLLYGLRDDHRYRRFSIRKRSGHDRSILAPIKPLKVAQRAFAALLDQIYKPRACVYGYIQGRGIRQNASLHAGQRWLLRIDLKDFFPSIHFGRVRGMFLKKPFSFAPKLAEALATLTTLRTELPQGAPTSPVISNLICQHLDSKLLALASVHRCYYSRYADDIIFSTSRTSFPQQLASLDSSSGSLQTVVGQDLRLAIQAEGFSVNDRKTCLKGRTSRQMCTGLIVNQSPNIPRSYIRNIRSMLHSWKRHGFSEAGAHFFSHVDKRNRITSRLPDFRLVVRGRVQYVGSIKGWDNPVYRHLADVLSSLDSSFRPKCAVALATAAIPRVQIQLYAEGKTDYLHLQAALAYFQQKGLYQDLELICAPGKEIKGADQLYERCETLAYTPQQQPTVFMFDSDRPNLLPKISDPTSPFKTWGKNVFSFAIPAPVYRSNESRICIEMMYTDADLMRVDSEGRRLFLQKEFNDRGFHESGLYVFHFPKSDKLIVDKPVYDKNTEKSVGLSKNAFAEYVMNRTTPFDQVSFEGFAAIFDILSGIGKAG